MYIIITYFSPISGPPSLTPECWVDENCPQVQGCVQEKCVDLCKSEHNPCRGKLVCHVLSSSANSRRTLACRCPIGYSSNDRGDCVKGRTIIINQILELTVSSVAEGQSECLSDDDCSDTDKCHFGSCQYVCILNQCGIYAECRGQNHRAVCKCPERYSGNPYENCLPGNIANKPATLNSIS